MFNQSGQEEGPFELLVAVVIMGFVIFVGMMALENLRIEKCKNEIDAKLESFKTSIESTVNTLSPQSLVFAMPAGCFSQDSEKISIERFDDPIFCASYCGGADRLCSILTYRLKAKDQIFSNRKCLHISPNTSFSVTPPTCPNRENDKPKFQLQDFSQQIKQGQYELVNVTNPTSDFPTICAYIRVGSI